jgi:protein O-mannosyl-transferase
MRREWFICLALTVITLFAFWPVGRLGFILFDDHHYVTDNPNIQGGITIASVHWALTAVRTSNWHPVTWLSHMVDFQLFGLNPAGHHWVNLAFHVANTLLLFFVVRRLCGVVWRSALVAVLFGLHPTHIESVAWVSERKDVLSAFFFLLTLWAYARYAQRRSRVEGRGSRVEVAVPALVSGLWTLDYALALFFFALGLMSKPMLVTVPVVLLLLDFWPLGRWRPRAAGDKTRLFFLPPATGNWEQLILEKMPFAMLSLASCIVTVRAQDTGGSVVAADVLPWYWRVADALVFYTAYLGKLFWPVNLAIFYPYIQIPGWKFICSALVPVLLSIFCLGRIRSQPWMIVGWGWFLVMLLPVIGLVQVGMQSIADRYTYLPSVGLFLAVAWGMAVLASRSPGWRTGMTLLAAALIAGCLLDTRYQLHYWQNSVTLFHHAVEVTPEDDSMSNYMLGNAYAEAGNLDAAARCHRRTLQIAPDFVEAHDQLGKVLILQNKFTEAEAQFGEILQQHPDDANARKHLADALVREGKYAEADAEYANALMASPDDVVINHARAIARLKAESATKLPGLYSALKLQPTPELHVQIAIILAIKEEYPDAVTHYLEALQSRPDSLEALNNLAWLLATCADAQVRDGARAVKYAGRACELTQYRITPFVGTLAAAYAEAGRYDDAIVTAEKACALAVKSGEADLLKRNRELLILYRAHQPYRETTSP